MSYEPEAVRISTSSAIAGLLILGDQQFPGWEATVDGRTEPILTVDNALRGVYLPEGSHTVVFSYRALSIQAGAVASITALMALLLLCLIRRRPAARRDRRL